MDADGLDLLPLASPQAVKAHNALLNAETLFTMLGKFPLSALITPTCSASVQNLIASPFRLIGL